MAKLIYDSAQKPLDAFLNLFDNYINNRNHTNEGLALTWKQVQEMSNNELCTIGSHSVSHPDLRKITDAELKYELHESKTMIEAKINKQVLHFSYPHSFWSQKVKNALRQEGFKTATMGYGGKIRSDNDKFNLPRKHIVQP